MDLPMDAAAPGRAEVIGTGILECWNNGVMSSKNERKKAT
jgi:hypothetical protein